jgi:hypothetical protein
MTIYMAQAADGTVLAESLDSSWAQSRARAHASQKRVQTRVVGDDGRVTWESWRGNVYAQRPSGERVPMFPTRAGGEFPPDAPAPTPSQDALAAAQAARFVDWLVRRGHPPLSIRARDSRWVDILTEVSPVPIHKRDGARWDRLTEAAWEQFKQDDVSP